MTARAAGVEKSSSSAAANRSHAPAGAGSCGLRNTSRNRPARAAAWAITSSSKSTGLLQAPERWKRRSASRPHSSSTSRNVTTLPSDFDIFSSFSSSMPLCTQTRANSWPRLLDCASSFSWCGKRRSTPPPWISNAGPRNFSAIAEHSMCQPGRPGPQGESQAASSCSFCDFQRAKSRWSRFSSLVSWATMSSSRAPESRPYSGNPATLKYTSPFATYACSRSTSSSMNSTISGIVSVARGSTSGRPSPRSSVSSRNHAVARSESVRLGIPCRSASGTPCRPRR